MTQEQLSERLQTLINQISECTAAVQGGTVPNMARWEEEAVKICADIENTDPAIAKALEQQVLEMIISLEKLSRELEEFQDKLQGQTP